MSVPSFTNYVVKRPFLRRWMQPIAEWYTNAAGYRRLGLRWVLSISPAVDGSIVKWGFFCLSSVLEEGNPVARAACGTWRHWSKNSWLTTPPRADDLIPEESELVQTALRRLPPKDAYDRVFRLRRAFQVNKIRSGREIIGTDIWMLTVLDLSHSSPRRGANQAWWGTLHLCISASTLFRMFNPQNAAANMSLFPGPRVPQPNHPWIATGSPRTRGPRHSGCQEKVDQVLRYMYSDLRGEVTFYRLKISAGDWLGLDGARLGTFCTRTVQTNQSSFPLSCKLGAVVEY